MAILAVAIAAITVALGTASALGAGPPLILSTGASQITTSSATLEGLVNPNGKKTSYRFEYLDDAHYQANPVIDRFAGAADAPVPNGSIPSGEVGAPAIAPLSGLSPATLYHFRLIAAHTAEAAVIGPEQTFGTYPGPIEGLPDGRAYEQVSPVDKNGGDVTGTVLTVKASPDGDKVTFLSTFGVPGGVGAAELPLYLASRGSDWSTEGLLPPPSFGQTVRVTGWTPDFSQVFERAFRFGEPRTAALLSRPQGGGPITEIAPYTQGADFEFAGASADGSKVVFESPNELQTTPAGIAGHSNVYLWNGASKSLSLLSVLNDKALPKDGAFAGPYDWVKGETTTSLGEGGTHRQYYTQDEHAISEDGSTFFTAAGTGQLYLRRNPAEAQSAMVEKEGKEVCSDGAKACTIAISESEKTNGKGPGGRDVAGSRPAAFMASTEACSRAFFTSAEKLTNDATTGAEPVEATIGRAKASDGGAKDEEFLKKAAAGMVAAGGYLYWADAKAGAIGRAKLNGEGKATEIEEDFVKPGPITVKEGEEVFTVASRPQYVAVANGFLYWTDATDLKDEHGTIGRAKLGATEAEDVEAKFIKGASDPQGIAVNASTIYWSNSGEENKARGIGAANAEGGEVKQGCIEFGGFGDDPQGLALDATHLYWANFYEYEQNSYIAYLERADLGCEEEGSLKNPIKRRVSEGFLELRGIALDSEHVYWAEQKEGNVGRADLELSAGSLEAEFISAEGSLKGVATDGEHVYWSANGETPPNPGNDLYRYDITRYGSAQPALVDLTVDDKDPNGAEVKGVLGIAKDGSALYFAANGDLDGVGPAVAGNCKGGLGLNGSCSLYRWEEDGTAQGRVSLIAPLDTRGNGSHSDATNWTGTPTGVFTGERNVRKTAWVSGDGQRLLFRSQEKLSGYDNKGTAELYLYQVGEGIVCVSCNPSGAAPSGPPSLGTINPSSLGPPTPASVSGRNFAAEGKRIFFESTDALVSGDTNGEGGCPSVGTNPQNFPRCLDVYEWEAAGTGGCKEGAEAFSGQNGGCLYLLSSGKSNWPSFFLDASESGGDAFFFTRQGLVGQDKDELLDVYDVRVGGGIASQNKATAPVCESADACHGPAGSPPSGESPASATFSGPGDQKPKHQKAKHKAKKKKTHHKRHAKGRASR